MAYVYLNIMSEGCKPVELTGEEIKMIKKINRYTIKAVIYFLAAICFVLGSIVFIEKDIDIFPFIFFILFGLGFAKIFYSHIQQKIEYAFYGTVTKKEVRYGMSFGRFTPAVTDYSKTVPQKNKEYSVKYYFVSVLIDGVEIENICCLNAVYNKIDAGDSVIIAKGYNVYDEPLVYKK